MTRVIDGVHVLSYTEWCALPSVQKMLEESPKCEECDGAQEHECTCGHWHTCGQCDGSGHSVNLAIAYRDQVRAELERLMEWREGLPRSVKGGRCE
jgi:hypothetical protein